MFQVNSLVQLSLDYSAIVVNEGVVTLSQTSHGFHMSFEKTVGKEKLLITSNFSFSHSVFDLFGEISAIFMELEIVVCKLFQFGRG